jgi:hypothetical protein
MGDHGYPTDPERELAKARIAVWLDVEDVRWIVDNDLCPRDAGHHDLHCQRIRFRADVALDKMGLKRGDSE